MTAVVFSLTHRETGGLRGAGLLCVDVRYASVYQARDWMIERVLLTAIDWRQLAHEIGIGLPPRPLPRTSRIAQIFSVSESINVQWLRGLPVTAKRPELVMDVLDEILRSSVSDEARPEPMDRST